MMVLAAETAESELGPTARKGTLIEHRRTSFPGAETPPRPKAALGTGGMERRWLFQWCPCQETPEQEEKGLLTNHGNVITT